MEHWNFVLAAYGVAGLIVAGMILWIGADYRALMRRWNAMSERDKSNADR